MNKKRIIALIASSLVVFSLVACKNKGTETNIVNRVLTSELEISNKGTHPFKTIDFNLGEKKIDRVSYIDRGIMSLPTDVDGAKLKPIILLHGCHDNDNIKRFDTGFTYLTEYLAQNGYLAISLDINAAYDWKMGDNNEYRVVPVMVDNFINSLTKANEGENIFGTDLSNKIDLKNISLMGHSTAGEIIFTIAEQQKEKGVEIKSLLALAPTNNSVEENFKTDVKNIAIVVPELDGYVVSLDGLNIYEELSLDNNYEVLSSIILKNANHNYFSREVERNDAEMTGKDISNQLSRVEQENFLKDFMVSYYNTVLLNEIEGSPFDVNLSNIVKINGYDIVSSIKTNKYKSLVNIVDTKAFELENVDADIVVDSPVAPDDNIKGANTPYTGKKKVHLLNVKWNSPNGEISFNPEVSNLKEFRALSIRLMVEGGTELNPEKEAQGFTIELEDKNGARSSLKIDKESNLAFYPKGIMDKIDWGDGSEIKYFWSDITPFSNIKIPLDSFNNIDLSDVVRISIKFNETESGSLLFKEFGVN